MVAMMLMSMVTATCIWVFRKSLDIYQTATGNAEVNQSLRVAFEKINQDLSACLPLSSGEQRFLMISRFADDDEWGKSFPRDYLSFATTTRVRGDTTTALVSYDITETLSGLPILWRYSQKTSELGPESTIVREVLCEYCTEFRIEYLWHDPRTKGATIPSANYYEKQAEDPGLFLTLWPYINEDPTGLDANAKFKTGGLNGISIVEHSSSNKHAGAATDVQDEFYVSYLFPKPGGTAGISIPFRGGAYEVAVNKTGMLLRRGATSAWVEADASIVPPTNDNYNRIILIRSNPLINDHQASGTTALLATDPPLDITANFGAGVMGANIPLGFNNTTSGYNAAISNPVLWPTYVPQQIRVTMKAHNKGRSVMLTRTKTFWIPSSGS